MFPLSPTWQVCSGMHLPSTRIFVPGVSTFQILQLSTAYFRALGALHSQSQISMQICPAPFATAAHDFQTVIARSVGEVYGLEYPLVESRKR